jgi:hypothetical protein
MKKTIVAIVLILISAHAFAQSTGAIQGHSYLGGMQAITSGLKSTNYANGIIPGATITVYLTGTQTKATIYADGKNTPRTNPFTSNALGGVNPGGWLFFAATAQGYDVVASGGGGNASCTTAPNCYAQPVTLCKDCYPSSQFTVTTGVTSAQGTTPIEVDGASGTPETGSINISCPTCTNLTTAPVPPISGQYVVILPTAASLIQGGPGPGCGGPPYAATGASAIGNSLNSVVAGNTTCGNGLTQNTWGASWTFTGALAAQAPWVVPANVESVYAFSFNSFGPFYPGTSYATITCTASGGGAVGLEPTDPEAWALAQFTGLLPTATGSNLDATTCTGTVSYSTAPAGDTTLNAPAIGLIVYYTGTAPPASTAWNCAPPFYCNAATNSLGVDPNAVFSSDLLLPVSVAQLALMSPFPADQLMAVYNAANSSTCISGGGTTYVQCLSTGTAWAPYSGGGSMVYPGAGVANSTGSAWGTSYGVGTGANDLVQLNGSSALPAVSGANLTTLTAANIAAGALANGMTGTTQSTGDNTTKLATDAFVLANASGGGSTGVLHSGVGAPSEGTAGTITHVQGMAIKGYSLAFGSSVTSGNLLIVVETGESGMATGLTPTDTLGTGFTQAQSMGFTGGVLNTVIFIGAAPSSGADTVAWAGSGVTNPSMTIEEFSGAANLVDVLASPVLNGANPSTTLTPTLSGDLVFGFGAWLWDNGDITGFTAGSGFTLGTTFFPNADDTNSMADEYILSGSTSLTTAAISQTANDGSAATWSAVAIYAKHTGSVGNDGDFYLDTNTGLLYGPRMAGIYLPFGAGLGVVKADGTSITNSGGVLSSTRVSSINGTPGAFTFSGPGVSCSGTACAFSGGGGSSGPLFKQYSYVPEQSSSLSSITSPAITVAVGDLLVVACRGGNFGSSSIATDSAGNSYSAPSLVSNVFLQMSWAIAASSGSDTFTCTPTTPTSSQAMVVLDLSGTGAVLNTSISSYASSSSGGFGNFTPVFSSAFTTTQRTVDILCASASSVSGYWTPWTVGPGFGTLIGVSGSNLSTNNDMGCEYLVVPYASGAASNSMLYGANPFSNTSEVLAFNY